MLRRILRRAVRYGLETLKCDKGFFSSMVPVLAEHVKDTFPEVSEKMERVKSILASEEKDFSRTIEKGRAFFTKTEERLRAEGKTEIPGTDAFYMWVRWWSSSWRCGEVITDGTRTRTRARTGIRRWVSPWI